jgi:hypothetical protein
MMERGVATVERSRNANGRECDRGADPTQCRPEGTMAMDVTESKVAARALELSIIVPTFNPKFSFRRVAAS